MCEKHKASTNQTPKPQDTDISRYKALHQGMQALQAEKCGVWIRFFFLWALTAWCVSIFQRRPGGYAATKKGQKITQLIAAKQEKLSFIFPKG